VVNIVKVLFGLNKKEELVEEIQKVPVSFEPKGRKKVSLENQIQEEE
tara:strand:- start:110 stop:250 length:141 start_codon:yes stop_codon:yes gene_type:complete